MPSDVVHRSQTPGDSRKQATLLPDFIEKKLSKCQEETFVQEKSAKSLIIGRTVPGKGAIILQGKDYLNISNHPEITRAQIERLENAGRDLVMSDVFLNEGSEKSQFEKSIARFAGFESAVLCQSGWAANVGLIQVIADEMTPVYIDFFSHMSLWEGIKSSGATPYPFRHNDPGHFERLVKENGPGIVLLDSLFSTTGEIAPLEDIIEIAKRYGCASVVDESDSLGTHGYKGAGLANEMGLNGRVDFITGSLSNAFASRAGIIFCSNRFSRYFPYLAFPSIFGAALMSHEIAALQATLKVIIESDERRRQLHENAKFLREGLRDIGYNIMSQSQLISIESGMETDTEAFRDAIERRDVFGSVFGSPVTPKNRQKVRFSLHSELTSQELEYVLNVCAEVRDEVNMWNWSSTKRASLENIRKVWGVPVQRNPYFIGRNDILDVMRSSLRSKSKKLLLYGMGGVGKSQIVAEYCYRNAESYDVVWWLRAGDVASLASDYAAIAGKEALKLPEKDAFNQDVAINDVLKSLEKRERWLLVFDDARDYSSICKYFPQSSDGHIIITSRSSDLIRDGVFYEIKPWSRSESVEFLHKRTGEKDAQIANKIASSLCDFPLALEMIAAYFDVNNSNYQSDIEQLVVKLEGLRSRPVIGGKNINREKLDVLTNLGILFQFQGRYRDAESLFKLVLETDEKKLGIKHSQIATDLNNLGCLLQAQGKYSEAESLYRRALRIVETQLGSDHLEVAQSMNNLGSLLQAQGRYTEAEKFYIRSLQIREIELGLEHPYVGSSLNNLAGLLEDQGNRKDAEGLYRRALKIFEQALGTDNLNVATVLNNLAVLLQAQSNYSESAPLYERALMIREKQLGIDHPDVANSLNNLAGLLQAQGKYKEAVPLYERALMIREKQLGVDHPDVANSLNDLAGLFKAQGKYNEAESLLRRALWIREQRLKSEHPDVAISLNNLGGVLQAQGKYDEATTLVKRALSILERQLGINHPSTDMIRGNMNILKN